MCMACPDLCPCAAAVMFPMDLLEKGISANNFGMLGLGDIVVPGWSLPRGAPLTDHDQCLVFLPFAGLYIALLCRFDFR